MQLIQTAAILAALVVLLPQPVICMQYLHYLPGKCHTRANLPNSHIPMVPTDDFPLN